MTGFLDVVLRGLALWGQAVGVGGVVFVLLVLRPSRRGPEELAPAVARSLSLIAVGAATLGLAQGTSLLLHLSALADERGWPVREALATQYFRTGIIRILACVALGLSARAARGGRVSRGPRIALVGSALVLVVAAAWLSHAAARLGDRGVLLGLDILHQLGGSLWVGGLVHLVVAAFGDRGRQWTAVVLPRFSTLALASVGLLLGAGVGLSLMYVDGVRALLGTSYGVMVLTKVVILAALLGFGAANFSVVRRLPDGAPASLLGLRRFAEVELGLGLTALLAAASLTSLPPAVDVTADRATLAEVASRFTPRWPTLTSPPLEALPIADPEAPRTDADRAWSEYNHHMAGLFVLAMGLLAMLHRLGGARWARHWPLIFLGLAAFMFVRDDPGSWPLGPEGFWEGFTQAQVLQHRVFVLLVVAFGLFEWLVRTERLRSPSWALVFPLLCAVGGALLLTHSHALLNAKAEFLTEVTHAPLGVLAMVVGWGRWLELRLPEPANRRPGRLWAVGLALIGALLLLYRES